MSADTLLRLINDVIVEAESYSLTHQTGSASIEDAKRVLHLLKEQIISDHENISIRILRAMHDVGMSSYKDFENTLLEKAIENLTAQLYDEVPVYRTLEPLREDFGKGYPV